MRLAAGGRYVSPFNFRYAPLLCDCHHRVPVDRLRRFDRAHGHAAGSQRCRDADGAGRSSKPTPAGDGHIYSGTDADLSFSAHGNSYFHTSQADGDIYPRTN